MGAICTLTFMKLHRRKHGCSIGEIRIDPQHASRVSCRRLIDFSQRKALFFQSQIEYGDSSPGNEFGFGRMAHSVLTEHLQDREGTPTRAALDQTLTFFREKLGVGSGPGPRPEG